MRILGIDPGSRVTGFGEVPEGVEPLEQASILLGGRFSDTLRSSDPFTFGLPMLLESEWMEKGASDALAKRELEVLRLAARGMTRGQIAYEIGVKEDTVKKHLSAAYRKLNASNRTEALRNARVEGLL